MKAIPLASDTREQDITTSQHLVNVYPKQTLGGVYNFKLIGSCGLSLFARLPVLENSGFLKLHVVSDTVSSAGFTTERLFGFTRKKLYEVFDNGEHLEIGDIDIKGEAISVSDNGFQMIFVDGIKGYYIDFIDNEIHLITQESFYPSDTVTFQDGFFILNRNNTGQFYVSNLLSVEFDALNYATAEGKPDVLKAVISVKRQLYLFGSDSVEIWYNAGTGDFPFRRTNGVFVDKGIGATYTLASSDNGIIYFVSSDLCVYALSGYTVSKVSNSAVDKDLTNSLSGANGYTYIENGISFYVLSIPSIKKTWCYAIESKSWFIKQDTALKIHRVINTVRFNKKTIAADRQAPFLYIQSENYYTDIGLHILREIILPTVSDMREEFTINKFEIDMSTGFAKSNNYGSNPVILMSYSKDRGVTWSNERNMYVGKQGDYMNRVKINRLGRGRQFTIKLSTTEPMKIDLGGAWIE